MYDISTAKILFEEAEKLQLHPEWLTDYGLFSFQQDSQEKYCFYNTSILNSHLSIYLAKNKHATRVILGRHNLKNIDYCLPKSLVEAKRFLEEHQKIVLKPTQGRRSEGVHLINLVEELEGLSIENSILEKYILGKEYRYLILNGEVLAVHQRVYDTPINTTEDVKRISFAKADWNKEAVAVAIKTAAVMGLQLAAVDFLVAEKGEAFILEVNSAPGIYHFHFPSEGPAINAGKLILIASLAQFHT